jgi:hypothetical protein
VAYCTYIDITDEIGEALGTVTQAIVERRILKSDERIVSILREAGIDTAPVSDTDLRDASICFTCAWLKRRQAHELSRPGSISLPGLSFSTGTSPEAEAAAFETRANESTMKYANYAGGSEITIVPNADDPYLEMR